MAFSITVPTVASFVQMLICAYELTSMSWSHASEIVQERLPGRAESLGYALPRW